MNHLYTSIIDLLPQYDAIWLDSYGVLKNHSGLLPGINRTIEKIRKASISIHILTNDASRSPELLRDNFNRLGLKEISQDEIITSGMISSQYLELKIPNGNIAYLGTERSAFYIKSAGLNAIPIQDVTLSDIPRIKALIFLDDEGFNWEFALNNAVNLLRQTNIPCIVANSDLIYPVATRRVNIATGGLAMLVQKITGQKFIYFGKPDSQMFNFAYQKINEKKEVKKSRILMVGDSIQTDILGANKFGIATMLVLSGNTNPTLMKVQLDSQGVTPNYVSPNLSYN